MDRAAVIPTTNTDLEGDLSDLERMADIAVSVAHEIIGETAFAYSDGSKEYEVVGHSLTPDSVSNATFAVIHLREMIQAMQKKYGFAAC